ncbi:MAG TPA: transposase [Verrucomicrobiae bacterium]|nr:transposase [Verrucomicrobiae bacterium]
MPRALRIEYPGAIYHLMNRGDRREPIFRDDLDRSSFLTTLGDVCRKTDWQVHAYCLMPNHFHLVAETPNANLVAGMHWFLSTYTARFNHRHKLSGHLFSGRYKALIVDGSANGYLRTVCDYVHLNPVRAQLLHPGQKLREYPWSSWPEYLKASTARPPWLRVDRLLGEYYIPLDSTAGRTELENHLERRRPLQEGDEFKSIRRGWCLGTEAFRRELLAQAHTRAGENHQATIRRETTEEKARRLVQEELDKLHWTEADLIAHAKGDSCKVFIARRLRTETSVTMKWIARVLHMGTWTHVANRLRHAKTESEVNNQNELHLAV